MVIPWLRKQHPQAVDINYDFDTGCFWVHFADKSMLKIRGDELVEQAFPPVVNSKMDGAFIANKRLIEETAALKEEHAQLVEKLMRDRSMVNSGEAGQYQGESQELQIRKADKSVTALLFIPNQVANKLSPVQFNELRNHVLEAYRVKVRELIGY